MDQRTPEWYEARRGKVTASRIADLTARTRNGWGASRANYMAQILAERLTGIVAESYTNAAMQHGIDTEPLARTAYEFFNDCAVEEVGFVDHPHIAMSGASPDGRVASEGMVEIKCPNTATHIDTLLGTKIADKYMKQMYWQMACDKRDWCDFVSFDDRLPTEMQLFVKRIERDDKIISELEEQVEEFLAELDAKEKALRERYQMEKAA